MNDSQFHEDHATKIIMTDLQFEEVKAKVYCIKGIFDALEDFRNKINLVCKDQPEHFQKDFERAMKPRTDELYNSLISQFTPIKK